MPCLSPFAASRLTRSFFFRGCLLHFQQAAATHKVGTVPALGGRWSRTEAAANAGCPFWRRALGQPWAVGVWRWNEHARMHIGQQHAVQVACGSSTVGAPEDKAPEEVAAGVQPDPGHIMQIGMGFMASRVLQVAVGLDLFTVLGHSAMNAEELGRALELHPRGTYDFFDALVALKLLDREGDGVDGRYRNTPSTAAFLDRNSPKWLGGIINMMNSRLYGVWGGLLGGLKTGTLQSTQGESFFDYLASSREVLVDFLEAMNSIQRPNFHLLAEKFDFQRYKSVSDAGCGLALLAIIVGGYHKHLAFNVLDLPAVTPHAQERIKAAGIADRVTVHAGDFFVDGLPDADVVFMGNILHDWNLEKKTVLIRAAYDALPVGGAFVVVEDVIDDKRRESVPGLLMSLNMLVETGDGFNFTMADFQQWCSEVGFRRFDTIPLAGASAALVAYK
ncbi:unnamed protein product [Ostreobium quekettii]|uniref:Methyltransferase n=1 Tax=Ostreobium quekettii TaxID=121088 RepID=A0A8S1J4P5_9CHLO|nr:unnamed protein product [Ostreobium quekettii]